MVIGDDTGGLDDSFERYFTRFDELLAEGGGKALAWIDGASPEVRDLDDWVLCRCDALVEAEGAVAAVHWLSTVVEEYPGFADAHHRLAALYEQLGNRDDAIAHHLETLRLDLEADELGDELSEASLARIAEVAALAIAGLPDRFRRRVGHIPVLIEARPSVELVREGGDSRSLGLFSGSSHVDEQLSEASSEPTQITLYSHCLWDTYGLDESELLAEVRVTVLHEVGHFFGLSEDELAELGLE